MKVCRPLWESGIDVELDICRRWLNFDVELPPLEGKLKVDEPWEAVVFFNQLLRTTQDREVISRALETHGEKPLTLVVKIRKYYPEVQSLEPILDIPLNGEPDYVRASKGIVDFFLNYLRFEEGVDVEELVEGVKKLVEKEQNVEEFLRLVGIDELIGAEEFLARVEKAADVLAKAKEQGLDVEEVLRTWDRLANGGGDRFRYLEEAVKAVAQREVGRRFWEEVERVLGEQGVKVSGTGGHEVAYRFFYLELANIEGLSVDLGPAQELLTKLASFMKKVRPVTLFTAEEVEKIFRLVGVFDVMGKEEVERAVDVLTGLDRLASSVVLEESLPIFEIVKEVEEEPKSVAEKTSKAIREGYREGMKGESLLEYIRKKVQT